jgi:outer membrane protein TolC
MAIMLWALLWVVSTTVAAEKVDLDTCIRTALENSPGALAAMERVEASRAVIRQSEAAFYPQISVAGNWTRTDNPPQAFMMSLNQRTLNMADPGFDPNHPDDTENYRLRAGMKWRLFDGHRMLQRDMAKLGRDAAGEQYAAVRNELIYQVIKSYYGVLQAEAFVEVRRESVQSLEESLRVAGERFEAGSTVKTDVLNLEVKLAQAREDLIAARNAVQLAVAALNTAVGVDLVDGELTGSVSPAIPVLPSGQEMEFVSQRPEYHAAETRMKVARKAYIKALRAYMPAVSAFGSCDWDSDEFSDFEDSYLVGIMAEWDVFTGFQRPGMIAQRRAAWRAAEHDLEKIRNNLRLDLRQAYLNAEEAYERLQVTRKSIESAQEALRITQEQYRQGAADITELLTAEVGLTATRSRDVHACYAYLTARSNIARARRTFPDIHRR